MMPQLSATWLQKQGCYPFHSCFKKKEVFLICFVSQSCWCWELRGVPITRGKGYRMKSCACVAVQVIPALKLPIISPACSHRNLWLPFEPFSSCLWQKQSWEGAACIGTCRSHPHACTLAFALCALVAGKKGFWSADLEQFWQQKGHKTVAFPVNQRLSWGAVGAWGRSVWGCGCQGCMSCLVQPLLILLETSLNGT